MIAAAALASLLALLLPSHDARPRFVVLHMSAVAYGVPGTSTIAIDRQTGMFARRLDAGAASEAEGWDGAHAWRADATGMPRIQGNAGERAEILAWSAALVHALDGTPRSVIHGAADQVTIAFGSFLRRSGVSVPQRIVMTSAENGTWSAIFRTVETPWRLSAESFAPPSPPHDATLRGQTRVPVSMRGGYPVIPVTINGTRLRFILDTGGQNVLTTTAAAKAGVRLEGRGIVNGGGGGIASIRYGFARSVRVGAAEMRHQPFIVLPPRALPPCDGIVGYELLARFAARLDMAHGALALAPHANAFIRGSKPLPFVYFDRQPQVNGSLDAIPGTFSIDTGSSLTGQVAAPFVRAHDLTLRLKAKIATYAEDVGGRYPIYLVRAHELRLGDATISNPLLDLMTKSSTFSNDTVIANIGSALLKRWIIVFDYPHQTLALQPGGDPSGNIVHDRSGMFLTTHANDLAVGQVLSGTPAAKVGISAGAILAAVDGRRVAAGDLGRVRSLLRGAPGTRIELLLKDGSTRELTLQQYL